MASGKISVFATTNETSLPITLTKIKKERPEMAVMVFSLRAFRELPSLSATDQRQLFSLGYLYLPEGKCCWWDLELKWCEHKAMRLMYVFKHTSACVHTQTQGTRNTYIQVSDTAH